MPKGTIKNTAFVNAVSEPNAYPSLKRLGTLDTIDPEGESGMNPPYEVAFVSSLDVEVGDQVRFHPYQWGPIVIAYVFEKVTQ